MNEHSDQHSDWKALREKVIGLGEDSIRKSYYPELQQRMRELQESEARFRSIFDSVSDAILVIDPETGAIGDVNERACEWYGCTRDEFQRLSVGTIPAGQHGAFPEGAMDIVRCTATHGPQVVEWQTQDPEGRLLWLEISLKLGKIGGHDRVLVVARDITERKCAEEESRALEESKRTFYRDTILSVTDGKLDVCDASETEAFLGKSPVLVELHDFADVRLARRAVDQVCGLSDDAFGDFRIAVGEAVSNAVKHASSGRVYAGRTEDEVWIGVEDDGSGIASIVLPKAVLLRGFSTKPSLGMGFSIMLAASDRILLNTGSGGTTVVLIKSLRPKVLEPLSVGVWSSSMDIEV